MSLLEKYRPQVFEDLIGQSNAVRALVALARRDECTPILITGPHGTGKTSAARIFARASNCLAMTPSGSPCLACPPCQAFEDESEAFWFYTEIPAGDKGDKDVATRINEYARMKPLADVRVRVFFVDEADGLEEKAQRGVLRLTENPGRNVIVFATTEAHRIIGPLASRCYPVTTRLATFAETLARARFVCEAEGFAVEPDALPLLASICGGHLRDLLRTIDGLAEQKALTVADIAERFHLDWADTALQILSAVARGDAKSATEALGTWRAEPRRQAEAFRDALVHVAHATFTPAAQRPDASAAFLLASPHLVDELSTALKMSPGCAGVPPLAYMVAMADHWSLSAQQIHSAGDLHLALLRQAHCIRPSDASLAPLPPEEPLGPASPRRRATRTDGKRKPQVVRSDYLTKADVRAEYRAGTLLLQEYGVGFNVRVLLRWATYGVSGWDGVRREFSKLEHKLGLRLREWTGAGNEFKLHYLVQHEIDVHGHWTSWFLCHIPPSLQMRAREWMVDALPCAPSTLVNALGDDVWRAPDTRGREVQTHWSLMGELWRAIDPDVLIDDGSRKRPLKEVLGVPPQRPRAGGTLPSNVRRFSPSHSLSSKVWSEAVAARFGFLSAWDAQKWRVIATGWELDEHEHRLVETARRADRIAEIKAQFPPEVSAQTDLTREQKLRAFLERLPHDPMRRPRSRTPW